MQNTFYFFIKVIKNPHKMKKITPTLYLLTLLFFTSVFGQKVCKSNKEPELDLNSIVAKCSVEKWEDSDKKNPKKSRQIAVRLSSRRRIIRKKRAKVAGLASLETKKINKINSSKASVTNLVKLETEIDDSVILPYSSVAQKPTFIECTNSNDQCFNDKINDHIKKYFSYPQEAYEKNIEGKVIVRFTINKLGEVENIKSSSAYEHEILKEEANRIIAELPKLTPAKQNNKLVNVNYGITINFKINDNLRKRRKNTVTNAVSFDKVEEIPVFNSCESVDKKAQLDCFNENILAHIQDNFSYPKLAAKNNISGKIWVNFVIGKNGLISNIKMKGPSDSYMLKTEARRIISLLPKFKPGKINGKKVNTKYTLPINFVLN